MRRLLVRAATAAFAVLAAASSADAAPIRYDVNLRTSVQDTTDNLLFEFLLIGGFSIDSTDFGRFGPNVAPGFEPILDFDLLLSVAPIVNGAPTSPTVVQADPTTASFILNRRAARVDETGVALDASGLGIGETIADVTVDKFDEALTFPNGRRVGDDASDLVIAALLRGSIIAGFAALTDPTAPPSAEPPFVAVGQVTPGDRLLFATAAAPGMAAVPVPAGGALLLAACGLLAAAGRRRPPNA